MKAKNKHSFSGQGPSVLRRRLLQLAGAGAALHWLPACGGGSQETEAERVSEAIAWGRGVIRQQVADGQAHAVTVALLSGDEIVWQEAFGQANAQTQAPATVDTRFNMGSVTKVVTALAAMILCDRGLLSLDEPITRYLPDFTMRSDAYRRITLRHLLSHSSGLPGSNYRNTFAFSPLVDYDYPQDTLECLAHFHIKHEPGEMAVYCNDGFTLVEPLVTAVTGLSFSEFVHREILLPLDMTHSSFREVLPEGAFVRPVYEGRTLGQEFVIVQASGGLATTAGDMMKFASLFLNQGMHEGKRIVSQEAIREMAQDQTTDLTVNPCPEWRWGLGWDSVRQIGMNSVGIKAWNKNGGTNFFLTDFFVLPEQKMAMFVSVSGSYNPGPLIEGALLRALQGTGVIGALPAPVDATAPPPAAAGHAAEWEGIYASSLPPYKVVAVDAGTLDVQQWQDGAWATIAPGATLRNDGWWWSDASPAISYRWEDVKGRVYLIARVAPGAGHYRLTIANGQRLEPLTAPLPQAWRERSGGRWQAINESPESAAILLGEDIVTLDAFDDLPGYLLWNGEQLLKPEGDDETRISVQVPVNPGRDMVELHVRMVDGQEELRFGTLRYRRLPA